MPKQVVSQATVISIKPSGENNYSVTFLTQKEGILYATLYGGPKSKLKSLVSPWNSGTAYFSITNNHSYKISDFDVKTYHLSFRESLLKFWQASLAAEIIIKTKCGGSPEKCWALVNGFLDGLDFCSEDEQCTAGLLRFLWRYLNLLGLQLDTEFCCNCGEKLTSYGFYNSSENGFSCQVCNQNKTSLLLDQKGLIYLNAISKLSPKEVRNTPLSSDSVSLLKQLLYYLIENATGSQLTCLKNAAGIL